VVERVAALGGWSQVLKENATIDDNNNLSEQERKEKYLFDFLPKAKASKSQ
jgi:hypothetical protein